MPQNHDDKEPAPEGAGDAGRNSPKGGEGPGEFENMRSVFETAGVEKPEGLGKSQPYLWTGAPIDEMANAVADFLRGKYLLFRRGRSDVVTVDEDTGNQRLMTPNRFRTWLPDSAGLIPVRSFHKESGSPIKGELDVKQTSGILSSDTLLFKLPSLEHVNPVPMPVFCDELDERDSEDRKGFRKMELSPFGYHAPSQSYTIHGGLQYRTDVDPNEAVKFFRKLFGYFPMDGRSLSVHVAAMLSVFSRRLYVGKAPMFLYNSNIGGCGKSKLAECAVMPVHGRPNSDSYDQFTQPEVKSLLDSIANTYKPYVLFDDFELPPDTQLKSNHLNRWVTADVWGSRTFGKNTERNDIPLEATTLMTGIRLNLEGQLRRRTLFVDLFAKQKARDRNIPADAIMITTSFMRSDERRAELLGALWALVRNWDDHHRFVVPGKPLESFEDWSAVVPNVVQVAGFEDPLQPFEAPDSGDLVGAEFKRLAESIIQEYCVDAGRERATISMRDIIRSARLNDLFTKELWTLDQVMNELENSSKWSWKTEDRNGNPILNEHGMEKVVDDLTDAEKRDQAAGWANPSINAAWGKFFKKGAVDGIYFEVAERYWEFGKRGASRGSTFELSLVTEEF